MAGSMLRIAGRFAILPVVTAQTPIKRYVVDQTCTPDEIKDWYYSGDLTSLGDSKTGKYKCESNVVKCATNYVPCDLNPGQCEATADSMLCGCPAGKTEVCKAGQDCSNLTSKDANKLECKDCTSQECKGDRCVVEAAADSGGLTNWLYEPGECAAMVDGAMKLLPSVAIADPREWAANLDCNDDCKNGNDGASKHCQGISRQPETKACWYYRQQVHPGHGSSVGCKVDAQGNYAPGALLDDSCTGSHAGRKISTTLAESTATMSFSSFELGSEITPETTPKTYTNSDIIACAKSTDAAGAGSCTGPFTNKSGDAFNPKKRVCQMRRLAGTGYICAGTSGGVGTVACEKPCPLDSTKCAGTTECTCPVGQMMNADMNGCVDVMFDAACTADRPGETAMLTAAGAACTDSKIACATKCAINSGQCAKETGSAYCKCPTNTFKTSATTCAAASAISAGDACAGTTAPTLMKCDSTTNKFACDAAQSAVTCSNGTQCVDDSKKCTCGTDEAIHVVDQDGTGVCKAPKAGNTCYALEAKWGDATRTDLTKYYKCPPVTQQLACADTAAACTINSKQCAATADDASCRCESGKTIVYKGNTATCETPSLGYYTGLPAGDIPGAAAYTINAKGVIVCKTSDNAGCTCAGASFQVKADKTQADACAPFPYPGLNATKNEARIALSVAKNLETCLAKGTTHSAPAAIPAACVLTQATVKGATAVGDACLVEMADGTEAYKCTGTATAMTISCSTAATACATVNAKQCHTEVTACQCEKAGFVKSDATGSATCTDAVVGATCVAGDPGLPAGVTCTANKIACATGSVACGADTAAPGKCMASASACPATTTTTTTTTTTAAAVVIKSTLDDKFAVEVAIGGSVLLLTMCLLVLCLRTKPDTGASMVADAATEIVAIKPIATASSSGASSSSSYSSSASSDSDDA